MKRTNAKVVAQTPEAPPAEPEVEPEPLPPAERPGRKADPSPFDPDWPDDLPMPQPKAWTAPVWQSESEGCEERNRGAGVAW
jgi:hypothetical protein